MATYTCDTRFTDNTGTSREAVEALYSDGCAYICIEVKDGRLVKEEAFALGEWLMKMSDKLPPAVVLSVCMLRRINCTPAHPIKPT